MRRVLKEALYVLSWRDAPNDEMGYGEMTSDPPNSSRRSYRVLASSIHDAISTVPAAAQNVKCRLEDWPGSIVVAKEATIGDEPEGKK